MIAQTQKDQLGILGAASEPESFEALYEREWNGVCAAVRAIVPSQEDAADVSQEAFARAYQRWPEVSSLERPEAWVFVTAYRLAISLRRRAMTRWRYARTATGPAPSDSTPRLLELLEPLSLRERSALLLHYHYGFPVADVAQMLGCRQGTAKSLLHRGRNCLKTHLELEDSHDYRETD